MGLSGRTLLVRPRADETSASEPPNGPNGAGLGGVPELRPELLFQEFLQRQPLFKIRPRIVSGYDAGKHTEGRKRHIVADVLGLILAVAVTGANVQDRDGGQLVLSGLKDRFARMARVWADGAYAGQLVEWAEKTTEFVLDNPSQAKGTDRLLRSAMALDCRAHLCLAG